MKNKLLWILLLVWNIGHSQTIICDGDTTILTNPQDNFIQTEAKVTGKQAILLNNSIMDSRIKMAADFLVFSPGFSTTGQTVLETNIWREKHPKNKILSSIKAVNATLGQFYPEHCIDIKGGVYVKDRKIIHLNESISPTDIPQEMSVFISNLNTQLLLNNLTYVPLCVNNGCNSEYFYILEGVNLSLYSDSTIINKGGPIAGSGKPRVDGCGNDYFNETNADTSNINPLANGSITAAMLTGVNIGQIPTTHPSVLISILDTGLDYTNINLRYDSTNFQYSLKYGSNNPENMLEGYIMGYNFVNNNNNPYDDHPGKHGTEVLGTAIKVLVDSLSTTKIEVIPYKTHDKYGLGLLSNIICALISSRCENVDIVNCSFSYEGENNMILEYVIQKLGEDKISLVAAAGNSGLTFEENNVFPAAYSNILENVITVSGVSNALDVCTIEDIPIYNTGNFVTDVVVKDACEVSSLFGNYANIGTSFCVPNVTAKLAEYYQLHTLGDLPLREQILEGSERFKSNAALNEKVKNGVFVFK